MRHLPAIALAILAAAWMSTSAAQPLQTPHRCRAPRPQMCMEIFMPVCGKKRDGSWHTYPNSCHACADATVTRYIPGKCKGD